jgi:chromosome segregation ATPase
MTKVPYYFTRSFVLAGVFICVVVIVDSAVAQDNSQDDVFIRLREEQVARQAAEQQVADLEAQLAQAEGQIDRMQAELAKSRLEAKVVSEALADFRLRAAHLLLAEQDLEPTTELRQLHEEVLALQKAHKRLYVGLGEFRSYLESALDIIDADDPTLRTILDAKLKRVFQDLESAERQLSGAVQDQGEVDPSSLAHVLAVSDDLQVVVLDRGRAQRVRPGVTWVVNGGGKNPVVIRVIEVRSRICAAVVEKGRIRHVAVGAEAVPVTATERK